MSELDAVLAHLRKLQEPATGDRIARLLGVNESTVHRWLHGALPRPRALQALRWFRRACEESDGGDATAVRVRQAFLSTDGLLGMGERGLFTAAGLGWLVAPESTR